MGLKITGILLAGVLGGAFLFSTHASAEPKGTSVVCPGKGCTCKKATFCDARPDGTVYNCREGLSCTVVSGSKTKAFEVPVGGARTIKIPAANVPRKMR
jgi:hypothetical protein